MDVILHGRWVWRPETPRERLERELDKTVNASVARIAAIVREIVDKRNQKPPKATA